MTALAYYLLTLLWVTPHWKRIMKIITWFKRAWARRPLLRCLLVVKSGDIVYLRDNPQPLTYMGNTQCNDNVTLREPPRSNAIVHTIITHTIPWSTFVSQVDRVNLRRVISW